jgi:hypothetical protein
MSPRKSILPEFRQNRSSIELHQKDNGDHHRECRRTW